MGLRTASILGRNFFYPTPKIWCILAMLETTDSREVGPGSVTGTLTFWSWLWPGRGNQTNSIIPSVSSDVTHEDKTKASSQPFPHK